MICLICLSEVCGFYPILLPEKAVPSICHVQNLENNDAGFCSATVVSTWRLLHGRDVGVTWRCRTLNTSQRLDQIRSDQIRSSWRYISWCLLHGGDVGVAWRCRTLQTWHRSDQVRSSFDDVDLLGRLDSLV